MSSGEAMLDFLAQCRNESGQVIEVLCTEATLELNDLLMHLSQHLLRLDVD
jgi:hypothetical protein